MYSSLWIDKKQIKKTYTDHSTLDYVSYISEV
jgi:hypothetical protein